VRIEVGAIGGKPTPLLHAAPVEVEMLCARVGALASLLAEAVPLAMRGLPITLTNDEAFVLAILSSNPGLIRQLLHPAP
jgi:hypothetical protein